MNDRLKQIVAVAFPGNRSRKQIRTHDHQKNSMNTNSYWDGGSRDTYVVVNLKTMSARPIAGINPMNPPPNWRDPTPIEPDTCIVEHSIFCGKDAGFTVHFRVEPEETEV